MALPERPADPAGYVAQFGTVFAQSFARLLRRPQAMPSDASVRVFRNHVVMLSGIMLAVAAILMVTFDAAEIAMMPARGMPALWPVRIFTDFGKDDYVLSGLVAVMVIVLVIAPLWPEASRGRLLHFGTRVQFTFFAVLLPVLCTQVLKWVIGRGRPFVGGSADAYNFAPFNGSPAYASLPSSHAVTAFAFAFAIGAIWPQLRVPMYLYAVAIAASRLLLLAHHPSDVVAGALVGLIGAMSAQYWFAARRLGFAFDQNGRIVPR